MPTPERGARSNAIRQFLKTYPSAVTKDVISALQKTGINVSEALVYKIKYRGDRKPGKKGRKSAARSHKAAMSMSDSIRQYITKNPAAGPKDIQAGLKAEGTKVKLGLISAVKYSKAKKGGMKKRTRTRVVQVAARTVAPMALSFEQLVEVKRLAGAIGGTDQVRHALDALAQLQ